jgi:hypothetical protein
MAEGNGGCDVNRGRGGRVLARLVGFYTPFRFCIRGQSGSEVGCRGQESGKLDMPQVNLEDKRYI